MWTYLLLFGFIHVCWSQYVDPERGPFCGAWGQKLCCLGRFDNCSLPRGYGPMETVCYCDSFCLRSHPRPLEPDCCPDYEEVCLNKPKPTPPQPIIRVCYVKELDRYLEKDDKYQSNCNFCQCTDVGKHMEIMCTNNKCLVDSDVINTINAQRRSWTAGNVTRFWGRELNDGYNGMLGTLYSSRKVRTMYPIHSNANKRKLPRMYDLRSFPGQVTPIVDQNFCNASWSFGIVSTFSDRIAKWSRGAFSGPLSSHQHRTCVRGQRTSHPCHAGYLTKGWKYLMNKGLVTEECYPESPSTRCAVESQLATKSAIPCPSGSPNGKLYRASAMSRIGGESAMMKEIQEAGPLLTTMRVFPDFFVYNSGIYDCPHENPKHGRLHSVKIIGWGEDYDAYGRNTPYWIVANSWGTSWGEDGFFRIARGTNACDIEEFVLSFYLNNRRNKRSKREKHPFFSS